MQKQAGHRLLTTYIVVLRRIPYICRYPIPIQNSTDVRYLIFIEYTGYHGILGKQCFSPFLFFFLCKKKNLSTINSRDRRVKYLISYIRKKKRGTFNAIPSLFPLGLEPVYKGHALFTPGSLSGNLLILGSFCNYLACPLTFFFFLNFPGGASGKHPSCQCNF